MLETNIDKEKGVYDYKNATEIDNLAYKFYMNYIHEKGLCEVYYTQQGFVGSVGCEPFYEKATHIIRGLKINKIKNETKIQKI